MQSSLSVGRSVCPRCNRCSYAKSPRSLSPSFFRSLLNARLQLTYRAYTVHTERRQLAQRKAAADFRTVFFIVVTLALSAAAGIWSVAINRPVAPPSQSNDLIEVVQRRRSISWRLISLKAPARCNCLEHRSLNSKLTVRL